MLPELLGILNLVNVGKKIVESIQGGKNKTDAIDQINTVVNEVTNKVNAVQNQYLALEKQAMENQAKIIEAESKNELTIVKIWRPVGSLTFIAIVFLYFGVNPILNSVFNLALPIILPPEFFQAGGLLTGTYAVGRSIEKGLKIFAGGN